jgi:riboflavin biosynthesis pyrimidine reductase
MKPYIICHMISSLDGGIHPSRWTKSPDGSPSDWSATYEKIHQSLACDAWMVGRVTMAEMSKATAHPPEDYGAVDRPYHFPERSARPYALVIDRSGKLHFSGPTVSGDHVVVLLGPDVPDSHLAELAADGVSYLVTDNADMDLPSVLDVLNRELGIHRLLLEGGGAINGSLFAAALVDELSLLVAPALDGRAGTQSFAEFGTAGLAGAVELSFTACEVVERGLVHLRYAVLPTKYTAG